VEVVFVSLLSRAFEFPPPKFPFFFRETPLPPLAVCAFLLISTAPSCPGQPFFSGNFPLCFAWSWRTESRFFFLTSPPPRRERFFFFRLFSLFFRDLPFYPLFFFPPPYFVFYSLATDSLEEPPITSPLGPQTQVFLYLRFFPVVFLYPLFFLVFEIACVLAEYSRPFLWLGELALVASLDLEKNPLPLF